MEYRHRYEHKSPVMATRSRDSSTWRQQTVHRSGL